MKTIVFAHNHKSSVFWSELLNSFSIPHVTYLNTELEKFLEYRPSQDDFYAVIVDRVDVDISSIITKIAKVDFFIVLDDWKDVYKFKVEGAASTFKFYTEPLLTSIIIDDIKSVTKIKDYSNYEVLKMGDFKVSVNARTVANSEKSVFLRNKEFDLLLFMLRNKGRVVSRRTILDQVWDMNSRVVTNTVDVHISKLRKILMNEFGISSLIKTVPCCGYILSEVYGE